jgi:hypothetical protein
MKHIKDFFQSLFEAVIEMRKAEADAVIKRFRGY